MTIEELGKQYLIIDFDNLFTKTTDIFYKQGEIGTTSIKAKLVKKRNSVDLTRCTVIVNILTVDGEVIVDTATIVDEKEGIIEIMFDNLSLKTGTSYFELTVVSDEYKTKKSAKFAYRVLDSLSEDAIIESEKYPILVNLIKDVDELQTIAQEMIDDTTELNNTITQAETVRQTNEVARQQTHVAMNELKGQVETLKSQTEVVKRDTEVVKVDTLKVKNDTLVVKSQTEDVKTSTLAVKSETEKVKNDTIGVKNATETVKSQTETVKNSTESVRVATNTVKTQAEEKIVDCENRMQTIEDTFDSLVDGTGMATKEYVDSRLDVMYADVEGSYITVKDSVKGAITDIEIFGSTVQDTNNLADIQSVGTPTDDGRFKMSILSHNKNALNINILPKAIVGSFTDTTYKVNGNNSISFTTKFYDMNLNKSGIPVKVNKNTDYIIKYSELEGKCNCYIYNSVGNIIKNGNASMIQFNTANNSTIYVLFKSNAWDVKTTISNIQLEQGSISTSYEQYQSNKSSILMPVQLGNGDRLYWCDVEKAWCIDKVEKEFIIPININWSNYQGGIGDNLVSANARILPLDVNPIVREESGVAISDKFLVKRGNSVSSLFEEGIYLRTDSNMLFVKGDKARFSTHLELGKYIEGSVIKYPTTSPQKIILPQDQQIALNSFFGTTHIFTEDTIIEPTIKAKVSKSLGATVSSLGVKADKLEDRLELVEGLQDSANFKYYTEKGHVVAENTNNGQIDALKLEGRTLVNLCLKDTYFLSGNYARNISIPTNSITILNNFYKNFQLSIRKKTGEWIRLQQVQIGLKHYELSNDEEYYIVQCASSSTTMQEFNDANILILEGDHTQNPPSYFEGLKSVGEDVDKIEVLTSNNLPTEIGSVDEKGNKIKIPNPSYKEHKKQLLYYNDANELVPVPCLREWDKVENSKYTVGSEQVAYVTGDESKADCITDMTTTVKKLTTPKIYETVNLDLNSYANETLVLCHSGAISPRMGFEITSHIGNTINVLRDRVNYLEDKFISMFKQVLAGDVQELAYHLYPQDFEDSPSVMQPIIPIIPIVNK